MKYVILAILMALSVAVGVIFSQKYRRRANFFKSLVMLCQKLEVEISYSRERLKTLFSNFDQKSKQSLQGLIDNYIAFIDNESPLDKDNLFKGITFLKEEEKEVIFLFFKSLGRSDVESQSREIKNFEKRFEELSLMCDNDNKKYGSLSIKLAVMAGLAIIIILI